MPKGIPLTEEEQQLRRSAIFDACKQLFLEKGLTKPACVRLPQAAGMGKSTLYDYFQSKEEIMIFYFEDALRGITRHAPAKSLLRIWG